MILTIAVNGSCYIECATGIVRKQRKSARELLSEPALRLAMVNFLRPYHKAPDKSSIFHKKNTIKP